MENNRLAKKVISVILNQEIEELTLSQQETIVPDQKRQFTLFRLDFKAIIVNSKGEKQTVLIELQKSKYITDIIRFKSYLGANYLKSNTEKDKQGNDKKVSYPIITIYILGYKLDDIPYLAVKVNHEILNSINNEHLYIDSDFIKHLNHRSHILQVRRLPHERRTRLEKFLVLFNQAWCTEYKYIIDLESIPEEFKDIAEYLQSKIMDEEFRRQLEAEEEIDTIFDRQENKYIHKIAQAEAKAKQKEKELEQKNMALINSVKFMKKLGDSIDEIQKETGLTKEEIEKL